MKFSLEKLRGVWQLQIAADKKLPAGGLRVGIAISQHMSRKENGLAWPGYGRIQKLLGVSRRTVIRGAKQLEARAHLLIKRRRLGTKNAPNHYQPVLKQATKNDTTLVSALTPPSDRPGTTLVSRVTPEPLKEPLSEPPNEPLSDTDAVSTASRDQSYYWKHFEDRDRRLAEFANSRRASVGASRAVRVNGGMNASSVSS